MKIYTKILLITLPLILFAGLINGWITWRLTRHTQLQTSEQWLSGRLNDAVRLVQLHYAGVMNQPFDDPQVDSAKQSALQELVRFQISHQGFLFVVDSKGLILAHPDPTLIGHSAQEYAEPGSLWVDAMLDTPADQIDFEFSGEKMTGFYERFQPWGWTIVTCANEKAIYQGINDARTISLAFNILSGLLVLVLIIFLTRRITTPVELVTMGAQELGRGNLKVRIPVVSDDEMGTLAKSFNQMAVQLDSSMEALGKSEKHYRALIENIHDVVAIVNRQAQVIYASPSITRCLGYKPWEVVGKDVYDFIHPEDLQRAAYTLEQVYQRTGMPGPLELRIRDRNGDWQDCDAMAINLLNEPTVSGLVITLRDIREHKQAEKLQRSIYEISEAAFHAGTLEELFRVVHQIISEQIPASNFYVALYDAAQNLLTFPYFIDEYEKAPPPSQPGRGLTEYVLRTGEPLLASPEKFEELVRLGEIDPVGAPSIDWLGIPLRVKHRSLGVLVVQSYSETVRFGEKDKEILMFVSEQAAMSIARKQAEDSTRISEARYRELFENSPVSMWEEDFTSVYSVIAELQNAGVEDFRTYLFNHPEVVWQCLANVKVLDVNQSTLDMYGAASKDELMGRLDHLMAGNALPMLTEEVIALAEGATEFMGAGVNYRIDGSEIDIILSWKMSSGPGRIVVSILDVTAQKRVEEQAKSQLDRINALRAIGMSITASLDLRSTLNVLLDQVSQQLHVDAAAVLLLDPTILTLEYAASRGFKTTAIQHTHLRLGEGFAGRAALERNLISNWNLAIAPGELAKSTLLMEEGFVAYIAAPLIAKGQVKGVLEIFHRKPMNPPQEWLDFLETLARQAAIAIDNATMFDDIQRSNIELSLAYDATIEGWSRALDLRDKETEGHTQRVTETTLRLALMLGVDKTQLTHLRWGALLHDIGKMGIPDNILLKPGPLDPHERKIMQRHPNYAYEMLLPIAYLRPALDIPYYHHERWDGTGYPCSLKGEEIPLAARIFSIIDVWDALRSDRPYRSAWSDQDVYRYIKSQSAKHFDPRIVDTFIGMIESDDQLPSGI